MENQKARSQILNFYGIFSTSLILSLLPHFILSCLGLVFSVIVLIACYITRKKHADDFFTISHLTFIIRSFWVGSFIMLATSIPAGFYMMQNLNNAPLEPCMNNINTDSADQLANMQNVLEPCIGPYIHANMTVYIIAGALAFGPGLLYITAQYIRGFKLARQSLPAPQNKKAAQ